jgi:hypothetical protein
MAISDLLLGLSAVLLIVLAVASARVQSLAVEAGARMPGRETETHDLTDSLTAAGRAALIAGPGTARLLSSDGTERSLARDALDRASLAPWLARLDAVPLLIVLPGGEETAFLAEPLLADGGLERIDRLRLTAACVAPRLLGEEVRCDAGR